MFSRSGRRRADGTRGHIDGCCSRSRNNDVVPPRLTPMITRSGRTRVSAVAIAAARTTLRPAALTRWPGPDASASDRRTDGRAGIAPDRTLGTGAACRTGTEFGTGTAYCQGRVRDRAGSSALCQESPRQRGAPGMMSFVENEREVTASRDMTPEPDYSRNLAGCRSKQ